MRDLVLIGFIVVVAIALGTFLFFYGPPSIRSDVNQALVSSTASSDSVSITILAQGTNAVSITNRTNYRIQNAHDLAALWALVYGANDTPTPPSVDFTQNEVLAVFDGSDSTNGYTIKIVSVTDQSSQRLVLVSHSTPATTCQTKNTSTSPFEIVEVSKTSLSLAHQDQMVTAPCP